MIMESSERPTPATPTRAKPSSAPSKSDVRTGAIRAEISVPGQWSPEDVAVLQNQEAKRVRELGSLIFGTPLQHDYEAVVEVKCLLSTEVMEEIDGRLAVTDVDSNGKRYAKIWNDDFPSTG